MNDNDNRVDGPGHLRERRQVVSGDTIGRASDCAVPDLATIAREPSYRSRRKKLAEVMTFFSGVEPGEWLLDHQMIATGLAAGHGGNRSYWPLGSATDDTAVVVGLVLHYAKHSGRRGLPIPRTVLGQLDRHVALGSAAARLVRDWLNARSVPCGNRRLWVHDGGRE